ncbi:hypothetical protein [Acinetobacter lanii]|uniref:hypothetical protein n=1 Tax=Acinetobacter lanii TaxID=2715163 RepID=UPI001D0E3224|nr:hypothetical protein [Acinetobacter lanii]
MENLTFRGIWRHAVLLGCRYIYKSGKIYISKKLLISTATIALGFSSHLAHATISFPEQAEIFAAAGFKNVSGAWRGKCSFGHIPFVRDLNGDGRPDAIIRDGGTACYGSTGVGFHLITKQATGKWTRILNSPGEPLFLKTVGRHGWPEIEIQTPSQCHTVYSWDGKKFAKNRQQFKGKPCVNKGI